jgi:heptosyltransferase-1
MMNEILMDQLRILIIRLSALGDIIHALPLLAALRERWPGAFVGWLVEPAGAPLLEGHPLLNALHVVPKKELKTQTWRALRGPARELLNEIKARHYDVAIDAQGLTKSAAWGWLAGIPRRIVLARPDARELAPLLATETVQPHPEALHVVERNLELLRPLGIEPPRPAVFPVHLPETARARAATVLGDDPTPLAVLACGAGWATKRWPPERFGRLARVLAERHGCRVALSWGPGEQPLVAEALRAAQAGAPDFDAAALPAGPGVHALPGVSFLELGAVIARARLVVGGDTGPTHLAAALGVPTVAMMGPLDARRNGPYGPLATTIQHAVPRRAPPWRNHRRWCDPRTRMEGIAVDEALAACAAALAAGEGVAK